MAIIDVALAVLVLFGFGISKWRKSRPKKYTTLDGDDNVELLRSPAMYGRSSPRISVSSFRDVPSPGFSPSQLPGNPGIPSAPSTPYSQPPPTFVAHQRRVSGGPGHLDSFADDEEASLYDDAEAEDEKELEDLYNSSPDYQRFLKSMMKTIETQSVGLSFDFENLSFETGKGKKILQGVTGSMPRGSCWGIMGGSGAGKSTFMNNLMGKTTNTGGTIKINGWSKNMSRYKKLIGYVPQDDIVFPELTVRENILHSARVRLPASWKDKAIQDHVDSLIACLALSHVQHSRVGDAVKPVISGGQRRRTSIGMELAAAPMAIFLDEPTSGLDATSAASIMRLLRAISRLGVTTIAIIHQPREEIFFGFDQLLLLARGRSVYSGPTDEVQSYFESMGYQFPTRSNPADTVMDIITGDGSKYMAAPSQKSGIDVQVTGLIDSWQTKGQYGSHVKHLSVGYDNSLEGIKRRSRRASSSASLTSTAEQEEMLRRTMKARGASWPAQVYYCWKRAMTQQIRNGTSFFFEIGVGALAGIVIGLSAFSSSGHLFQGIYHPPFTMLSSAVDYSSTPQLGLLGGMAIGLAASAPGFWIFGEEKLIYWRETASGHSRSAYYVGKLVSTLPRIGLSSLHFTVFMGILATPLISFQNMYCLNLLYFWCIYGLASVVSMLVKRENGPLLAVLASLIIGVLGGVAPPLSKVKTWHMEWFWRLSPGVWFTEAYFTENTTPLAFLYDVNVASKAVGFTLNQYAMDAGMLFLIGAIYRVVAYLGLVLLDRKHQR
ncbi:hypothetical protein K431DRAFT_281389 [Polychaeton citri CBS 116435]|uniref:ABC transporter domain-containing protein n=1 Tax=Polychaeton citri CBS 116435 TaxID=1314669 RepID=A0A9P4QHD4_9PEZI|nr:hypothetical protein K431DRAFT_281389 [Polychaeton citri CBS 116435]